MTISTPHDRSPRLIARLRDSKRTFPHYLLILESAPRAEGDFSRFFQRVALGRQQMVTRDPSIKASSIKSSNGELGDFRETVLEGKLIPRAPLQDSEPPRAGDSISDVFLVNLSRFKAQERDEGRE